MEEPIIFPLPDDSHYLEYIFLAVVARLQFYQKQVEDSSQFYQKQVEDSSEGPRNTEDTVIILSNAQSLTGDVDKDSPRSPGAGRA